MHELTNFNKNDLIKTALSLIDEELPLVSNLSNISSLLKAAFNNTSWAGFYLVHDNTLYLGPFQGSIACTVIPCGKGVCGTALKEQKTIIVSNVHEYPNHIACSSKTNSEMVVPMIKDNIVVGVIDLDSEEFDNYHEDDKIILEELANILSKLF